MDVILMEQYMSKLVTTLTLVFAISTCVHANTVQPADYDSHSDSTQKFPPPIPEITPPVRVAPDSQDPVSRCPENRNTLPTPDVTSDGGAPPALGS
jgi:hypothetical protein